MTESCFVIRNVCPACKSSKKKELFSLAFTIPPISTYLVNFYSSQSEALFEHLKGAEFIVDECRECGLVYQRFIPNSYLMNILYEEWIDPVEGFNSRVKKRSLEYYIQISREIEMCIRHYRATPHELKFLDFGMGWGEWCRMANAYGCSALGTELSQARIDYAKTHGVSVIRWEEITEHRFDFINTEQVFEHIPDPLETLQTICKSLKPGGIIKISVPNGWDIRRRLSIMNWTAAKGTRNSLNPIAPLEHINCYSQDSLVRMARTADLLPIQLREFMPIGKKLLDFTLRDIFRPYYKWVVKVILNRKVGTTKLFFQRKTE